MIDKEEFYVGIIVGIVATLLFLLVASNFANCGFTDKQQLQLMQMMEKVKESK